MKICIAVAALAVLLSGCSHFSYIPDDFAFRQEAKAAKPPRKVPKKPAPVRNLCEGRQDCDQLLNPEKQEAPVPRAPDVMHADDGRKLRVTPEEALEAQKHIDEVIKILEKGQS